MNTKPTVSVCCITYNHEKYIAEAIESFLMQKTNFPIEIIIYDDASTDNTANIIQRYAQMNPSKIIPLFAKENLYSQGINPGFLKVFPRCRGKYIALCEGDDFWTDPYKLQKQVDLMEKHPDYSACFHAIKIIEAKTGKVYGFYKQANKDRVYSSDLWYELDSMQTSLLFRRKYVDNLPDWTVKAPIGTGGIALRLFLSQQGKFAYVNQVMSCYRRLVPNSWTDRLKQMSDDEEYKYAKNMVKMYDEFNKYTNFKYSEIIAFYQLYHLIGELKVDKKLSRIKFLNKYKYKIDKLSFKKKVIFLVFLFFPKIIERVYRFFRRLKLLKNCRQR